MLGAEQFQKCVFWLEDKKYKVIDKFFPNIISYYDEKATKSYLRAIKNKSEEEKKVLLYDYQIAKLDFKKEVVYKKNRNYHFNPNYPTVFMNHLKGNRRIHLRSLTFNIFLLGSTTIFKLFSHNHLPVLSNIIYAYATLKSIIDLECINLQNYNIIRYNRIIDKLKLREEKKINSNIKKMGNISKNISNTITNQVELPSIDTIVSNIKTNEQAEELLAICKQQLQTLKTNKEKEDNSKVKKL